MEKLVNNGGEKGSAYVTSPYSSTVSSTWRVDNEPDDIQEYHVELIVAGMQVQAKVGIFEKQVKKTKGNAWRKAWTVLDPRSKDTLKSGETLSLGPFESFTLKGDLPVGLEVRRRPGSGCGTFTFQYGDPKKDGHRAFAFKSNDRGHGRWSHAKNLKDPAAGDYCTQEKIQDDTVEGGKVHLGTLLRCSFPGW